jgi:hypothetical protein
VSVAIPAAAVRAKESLPYQLVGVQMLLANGWSKAKKIVEMPWIEIVVLAPIC